MGCGISGGNSSPPPPPISVSVSPSTASVFLGATQQLTATVNGTTNTGVNWSVNGVPNGSPTAGAISNTGLYTAPQDLPSPATLAITATSAADPTKSASAEVAVKSDLTVSVSPATANVELGATQQFLGSISGSGNPDRALSWSTSGPGCSGAACGTVDPSGLLTAPQVRPTPAGVTLTARSLADPSKSASALVNITSNFTLGLAGPASVNAGTSAQFTATLTPAPNSNPSRNISWGVTGAGCSGTACGVISATGSYTAPVAAPSPNTVSITATPAADPTKAAAVAVAINAVISISVSPTSASVELGRSQPFSATVSGLQDTSVTWDVNGVVGGNQTVGTITNSPSDPDHTMYIAPPSLPTPSQVTVRARSNANPNVLATAAVTLFSNIAVQLSPSSSTRAINHRQTFTAQVANTANQNVTWQVNGIPGGTAIVGQICAVGVGPCQPVLTTNGGSADYLAPVAVPAGNPVTVSIASQADPAKGASAQVTVLAHILISVLPSSATLAPGATQQFAAQVSGTSNQNVTWQVSGAGCGSAGSPCGAIDSLGLYTAPLAPPTPDLLNVTATSADDTSRTGSAAVVIAAGATITGLLPASLTAGAAGGFPLKIQGAAFVPTSPGPGSTVLLNGSARTTTCTSSNECTITLAAADLAAPGNFPVQVRNPDSTASNQVSLVVVLETTSEDIIALTALAPSASGKDIVVVEPSAAGTSGGLHLNIAAMGPFTPLTNACVLGGTSVVLARPASGSLTVDICAFSPSGLDPALTYSITGPNDISIVAKQSLGLGIIDLTIQLSPTTMPGPRTLFVANPNKDKAAATGALEVK